jgi:hypothetical protein
LILREPDTLADGHTYETRANDVTFRLPLDPVQDQGQRREHLGELERLPICGLLVHKVRRFHRPSSKSSYPRAHDYNDHVRSEHRNPVEEYPEHCPGLVTPVVLPTCLSRTRASCTSAACTRPRDPAMPVTAVDGRARRHANGERRGLGRPRVAHHARRRPLVWPSSVSPEGRLVDPPSRGRRARAQRPFSNTRYDDIYSTIS